jgi:hypothetical protein
MFKLTKRIVIVATVLLAASAPSVAFARLAPPDPSVSAPAHAVNGPQVQNATPPSAGNASASSPRGFQWDDAGIGAAGAVALLCVASGVIVARRRRTHHPLTS